MEDQEDRIVAGTSRWTKARRAKKRPTLTDKQLMDSVPSFQREAIRAAQIVDDVADSLTPRSADADLTVDGIRSSHENENTEDMDSELEDWTSDVEMNENIFEIDYEEPICETREEQRDESDFCPFPCSPLPAATEMVDDLWDDNDDEYSDDDENYDQHYASKQKFENNASLKSRVTEIILAAMYLRHGFSIEALSDHLKLLKIVAPSLLSGGAFDSPYKFLKKYDAMKSGLKKLFLCHKCSVELECDEKTGNPVNDQPCGHVFKKNKACYSLFVPIEPQISYYIENHLNDSSAQIGDNEIGDVCSGAAYKSYQEQGIIDDKTITIQWNIDAAQAHEKSEFKFTPCMGIVNEAQYKVRRSNIILFGIHYHNSKLRHEQLVIPCIKMLNQLKDTGVIVDGVKWTVRLLIVTVDTIERCNLRDTTQFNGLFGCDFCLIEGIQIKKGNGTVRSYRIPPEGDKMPVLRSTAQHKMDLQILLNAKAAGLVKPDARYHGIVGSSPLLEIDGFDFQRSFTPDYLHSICLGVIKYLMMIWINGKKGDAWFISKQKMDILKHRLQQVKPPYEISRSQFNLDKIALWKASQFRAFALYFFPVLNGILPEPYYSHFCSVSYILQLLLQESAKKTAVVKCELLSESFVRDVEYLYGEEYVSYNIHLLPHLIISALEWGLPWAHSAFIPEGFNGELSSLFQGTQCVIEQMAHHYMMRNRLRNDAIDIMAKNDIPKNILDMLYDLLCLPVGERKKFSSQKGVQMERVKLLGRPTGTRILNPIEQVAAKDCFNRFLFPYDEFLNWQFFPRLMLRHGSIFTTTNYTRSPNRINYCAYMSDGNFVLIESIIYCPSLPFLKCFLIARVLGNISKSVLRPGDHFDLETFPGQTIKFDGTQSIRVYDATEILKKGVLCMYNSLSDSGTATALVNRFESD